MKIKKYLILVPLLVPVFFVGAHIAHGFLNPAPGLFTNLGGSDDSTSVTASSVIMYVVNILLGLVGIISILYIIIGGYQYITSAGNDERATAGKKTLTNAVIGLVIVILSYTIVVVVTNTLNGGSSNGGTDCGTSSNPTCDNGQ